MNRRSVLGGLAAMGGLGLAVLGGSSSRAQTDDQATIAALETRVSELETQVAEGFTPTPFDLAPPDGTVPFGEVGDIASNWAVQVLDVIDDPYAIDPSADWFTDWLNANHPPEGQQYLTVRLRLTNTRDVANDPTFGLYMYLLGSDEFRYTSSQPGVPGGFLNMTQLRPDESIEGNVCWIVDERDRDVVVLAVTDPTAGSDPVLFALQDD